MSGDELWGGVGDVDREVLERLTRDDHIGAMALEIITDLGQRQGNVDVYGWGFVITCLEEYRRRGGEVACMIGGPAAAIRQIMADTAEAMRRAGERIQGNPALSNEMLEGAARLRAVLERR